MVAITRCGPEEIREKCRELLRRLGGMERFVGPGETVLIKPNVLCAQGHETGATASPVLVAELCRMCFSAGAGRVVVAESANWGIDSMEAMLACGYGMVEEAGAELMDLKRDNIVPVHTKTRQVLDTVYVPEITQTADKIINVPVLKLHTMTRVTLSIKNMSVGISPDDHKQHSLHRIGVYPPVSDEVEQKGSYLECAMVDINSVVRNDLIVVDGVYGLHGRGAPLYGRPIGANLLLGGDNRVETDAVGATLLGYRPEEILHLALAHRLGIGELDVDNIQISGEPIDAFRFDLEASYNEDLEGMPENIQVVNGCKTCGACLSTLAYVCIRHREEFQVLGPVTVYVGKYFADEKPARERRQHIYYGNCAMSHLYGGGAVPGCPPRSRRQLMQALGALDLYTVDEGLASSR